MMRRNTESMPPSKARRRICLASSNRLFAMQYAAVLVELRHGVQLKCLTRSLQGLVKLAENAMLQANIELRYGVSGVGLQPEFVGFDGFRQIAQRIVVVGCDVKPFTLGHAVAETVGLGFVFNFLAALAVVAIDGAESGIGQGKVRIELDGTLVKRYSSLVTAFVSCLFSLRERFQRCQ